MTNTIENISRPGEEPQDGDRIRITHPGGAVEVKTFWSPRPPTPRPVELTPVEFLRLFTQPERIAIRQAAMGDTETAIAIQDWLDMARSAVSIILSDPETVAAVQYLVTAGLLTQERADAILAGQPPA